VTGVDISRDMLAKLREKLAEYAAMGRTLRVHVEEADTEDLPFQDGTFDAAVAVHVFHLVADPRRAVQEVFRVLQPTGSLLLCADTVYGAEQPSVTDMWRELVIRSGYAVPNSSEAASRLLQHLQSTMPGLEVEVLKPVTWQATVSRAEELDGIRRRLWSQTWLLPDEVFDQCFVELTDWYATVFAGHEDEQLCCTKEFVIRKLTKHPSAV